MSAIGGSLESVTLNGRIFPIAADAEAQRKLGGFENEVQANGDGTARIIKTRVPLSIDGLTVSVDDDRGDQEFLQEISDAQEFVPIVLTYPSGLSYQGTAIITGELQESSQSATAAVSLQGPGKLTKQ